MSLCVYSDSSVSVHLINENVQQLKKFTRFNCTVISVPKMVIVYIITENTPYFIILERLWLKSIETVEYYIIDQYWIKNNNKIQWQIISNDCNVSFYFIISKVFLSEGADISEVSFNKNEESDYKSDWENLLSKVNMKKI